MLLNRRTLSEWFNIIKIWSDMLEIVFEETGVELIWGDTANDTMKVDLRFCVRYEKGVYDIANIEFTKTIEGESTINNLDNLVGPRGMFKELNIVSPGAYIAQSYGSTIRYPTSDEKVKTFIKEGLQLMFVFKDRVVREAEVLKSRLMDEDVNFGSQSTNEDKSFLKIVWRINEVSSLHDDLSSN